MYYATHISLSSHIYLASSSYPLTLLIVIIKVKKTHFCPIMWRGLCWALKLLFLCLISSEIRTCQIIRKSNTLFTLTLFISSFSNSKKARTIQNINKSKKINKQSFEVRSDPDPLKACPGSGSLAKENLFTNNANICPRWLVPWWPTCCSCGTPSSPTQTSTWTSMSSTSRSRWKLKF